MLEEKTSSQSNDCISLRRAHSSSFEESLLKILTLVGKEENLFNDEKIRQMVSEVVYYITTNGKVFKRVKKMLSMRLAL